MRVSDLLTGIATGVPVMIVVGPIALLLVEQGLGRGFRGGAPAAVGVASADLAFSTVAALAGAAAASLLTPVEPVLRLTAVAVLGVLALHLWRSARGDLAAARTASEVAAEPVPAHASKEIGHFGGPVVAHDGAGERGGKP